MNPLYYSVVYSSICPRTITWDKSRFEGPITPISGYESMGFPVIGTGTMLVKAKENKKESILRFDDTPYAPSCSGTYISNDRINKQGIVWDQYKNCLAEKKTKKKICDVKTHFGIPTLEYNPIHTETQATESYDPLLDKKLIGLKPQKPLRSAIEDRSSQAESIEPKETTANIKELQTKN